MYPEASQADKLLPVKQLKLSVFNKRGDSIIACLKFFLFVPFSKLHKQTHKTVLMVPSWTLSFLFFLVLAEFADWLRGATGSGPAHWH